MTCPDCGVEHPPTAELCDCGHDFSTRPRKSLYEGSDDDTDPPFQLRGPYRKCAKCGSTMTLYLVENMRLNGLIPSGQRLYFQCVGCGRRIKLRSLWRNLLAIPGILCFAMIFAFFVSSPNWWVGVFTALLALYPLTLLFEIVRRIRYPSL